MEALPVERVSEIKHHHFKEDRIEISMIPEMFDEQKETFMNSGGAITTNTKYSSETIMHISSLH